MTSSEKRAMRSQLETQMRYERNAKSAGSDYVPAEIAAHMTAPKTPDVLHQVVVEKRAGGVLAVGPKMIRAAAEEFATVINAYVASGQEKTWRNATVVPCLSAGVH